MSTPDRSHANTTGARIRSARDARHWSQTRLAAACGWPGLDGKSRISRYERDTRTPSYGDAQTIGAALGIAPHTLLTGEDAGVTVRQIPLDWISPDDAQPRRVDASDPDQQDAIQQLAGSIREHGLLQPITLRPAPDGDAYVIVYGHRRYLAAEAAGLDTIAAIIRTDVEDETDRLAIQILENLQRVDLSLPELIIGISQLARTRTQDQIAAELGRSRSWVSRRASLHDCNTEVWHGIQDGLINDIDMAHAFDQLFALDALIADEYLTTMRLIADGQIPRAQLTRADIQTAAKDLRDQQQRVATAAREATEAQRHAEEQANDTSSGYDGPLEDTNGQPAEVTGSEGQHNAQRDRTSAATEDGQKRPYLEREDSAARDAEEVQAAIGRPVRVDPLVIDPMLTVKISSLSDVDWQSLKAHLLRWRPPAEPLPLDDDPTDTHGAAR